jgi:beta-lactamase regulating signal transducer with metallopeptidase domain
MNQFKVGAALTGVVGVAICGVIIIASLIESSTAFAWIVIILGAVRFFNMRDLIPRKLHPFWYVVLIGCITQLILFV